MRSTFFFFLTTFAFENAVTFYWCQAEVICFQIQHLGFAISSVSLLIDGDLGELPCLHF